MAPRYSATTARMLVRYHPSSPLTRCACAGQYANVHDASGRSVLHWAAAGPASQCLRMMHWFLSHGMDINSCDIFGSSVLHYTALLGKREMAQFLVESGADVMKRDKNKRTPMEAASWAQNTKTAAYLSNQQNAQELLDRTAQETGVVIPLGGGLKPVSHYLNVGDNDPVSVRMDRLLHPPVSRLFINSVCAGAAWAGRIRWAPPCHRPAAPWRSPRRRTTTTRTTCRARSARDRCRIARLTTPSPRITTRSHPTILCRPTIHCRRRVQAPAPNPSNPPSRRSAAPSRIPRASVFTYVASR